MQNPEKFKPKFGEKAEVGAKPEEEIKPEKIVEEGRKEGREAKESKFESRLKLLVGAERVNKIKERAEENLGVSINSELLLREYPRREFVGKNLEEAKTLIQEKLIEAPASEKERLKLFLEKPNESFKKFLEGNEKNYVDFLINKAESLGQFLESGIKNIRLNPWHAESWLNWEKVEKGKTGEFQIDSKAEEIIEAYTNFCGFLAEHFKRKINRFEISNEPNVKPKEGVFEGEFPNNPNSELYGKVAARAAEIIKNKNPKAEIIFGNVALFDPEFIKNGLTEVKKHEEELRNKGKLKPEQYLIDYVGFHPYRENPDAPSTVIEKGEGQFTEEQKEAAEKKWGYKSYEDQLEIYREIIDGYSPKIKLINTEIGWQIGKEGPNSVADEKTQAEYLLKAAAIDASHGISTNFFELFKKKKKKNRIIKSTNRAINN